MRILEVNQATAPLADYVADVRDDPVILTVNGKPVAAVIAVENADLESAALSTSPQFMSIIERSRSSLRQEGDLSPDEVRRELGLGG